MFIKNLYELGVHGNLALDRRGGVRDKSRCSRDARRCPQRAPSLKLPDRMGEEPGWTATYLNRLRPLFSCVLVDSPEVGTPRNRSQ